MSVKRYGNNGITFESNDGPFVLHTDYALLETRVKELEAERDRLVEIITKAGMQELIRFERAGAIRAFDILAKALDWSSGGLESAAQEIVNQRDRLKQITATLGLGIAQALNCAGNNMPLLRDALQRAADLESEAARKGE